jgi:uncharacterized protein YndB with AHSA1/START domain
MPSKNKTQIIAETGKQELFIIREFDAPKDLVFKAFSDEEILVEWVGCKEMSIRYEKFEPWQGGSWRYLGSLPNGMEFGFHGVCHEHSAPDRIIQTFEFEGLPEKGHVVLETARFEELPGERTRVTVQSVFQSVMDRDGMVQSGMERGVVDSHERLDELIEQGILTNWKKEVNKEQPELVS